MKRNIVGILALAGLLTSSCMDGFLERNPFGSIDETTFFTEPEHADLAAIACYSKLQKLNAHWGDAQLELGMRLQDLRMLVHFIWEHSIRMNLMSFWVSGNVLMKVLPFVTRI